MVRPEDAVGLVEHAGSVSTGGVEVYMVQQSPKNMGGLGDNLFEASMLQAGGEEVVRTLDVVGLGWVIFFLVPRGWVIFFCPERLGDFFLSLRGWVIFFASREVG